MTARRTQTGPGVRFVLAWAVVAAAASPLPAQVVGQPSERLPEPVDSADVQGRARREQARYETRRRRLLPIARSASSGSDCDERIGRFCVWFDESGWTPEPEAPEIDLLRTGLLTYLDSVQTLVPGDGWVLGQRVWYHGEAGRWADALAAARSCGRVEAWWCAALEGLALHGLARFEEAEASFERALTTMDSEQARRWKEPRRSVRGGVRDVFEDAAPEHRERALAWLWTMADPLWLVPGNDRRTEHFARWTVARIRERARNPFHIAWGRDLEEMLLRFGWEIGWERVRGWDLSSETVVGHQHPAGRDYMPHEDALRRPGQAPPEAFEPRQIRPRSLHAPAYAPVVLPMEGQVAVFPRADRLVVVATTYVPEDTTRRVGDDGPRPWMEAGEQAGLPDRHGLFLVPVGGEEPMVARTREGADPGGLMLEVPAGDYVVSAEAWSPPARLAGRSRMGVVRDTVARDVATLSDLLLVREASREPTSLAAAAALALDRRVLEAGDRVGVVWEVNGLGWHPADVAYELSMVASSPGLFRRLGEGLGLLDREHPLSLTWDEPGPARPEVAFRYVGVTLPDVDPGAYRLRLRVRITGRGVLTSETEVSIAPAH